MVTHNYYFLNYCNLAKFSLEQMFKFFIVFNYSLAEGKKANQLMLTPNLLSAYPVYF